MGGLSFCAVPASPPAGGLPSAYPLPVSRHQHDRLIVLLRKSGSGAHFLKEDIGTKSMNDPTNEVNLEDTSYIPSNTGKDDINSYNYEMASGLGA